MYCYWDFMKEQESDGPIFSEQDRATWFLYPYMEEGKHPPFGIVEISYDDFEDLKQCPYIEKVPSRLHSLLDCAVGYPPALMLTKQDINKLNLNESITKKEFSDIVINLLLTYMRRQWKDSFILAEVQVPKSGWTFVGSFYWVIGYTPKIKLIHFVGDEYFGDSDHVSCFKLTDQQIKSLPVIEMKKYFLFDRKNDRGADIDLTDERIDFDEISELIRTLR